LELRGNEKGRVEPKYPFTAIVGQDIVKTALILNSIDPTIGGVLISGPKGSGKSLLVRALSEILPDIEYAADCPFHCSPKDPTNMCQSCLARFKAEEKLPVRREPMKIVQIPLSVTDDMLVGSLDTERALEEGVKALHAGLLAQANQNILYIDEVNLLPDHITDSILDAAASGWNIVEREGVSVQHPARFILIGTMNPEEGELRPQILDRFGVHAKTVSLDDPSLRMLVIQRNDEFATDPSDLIEKYKGELKELRSRIEASRKLLPEVEVPSELYSKVAAVCSRLHVDGFRPDIVAVRAARALAAFHGRTAVVPEDLAPSIELALGHRTRQSGLAPPPSPPQIREALKKATSRGTKVDKEGFFYKIAGIVPLSQDLAKSMIRRALMGLVLVVVLTGVLALLITLSVETVRSMIDPFPLTLPTLVLEGIMGGTIAILLTLLLSRGGRQRKKVVGLLDLSRITLETERRLPPPGEELETGKGPNASKVTYGKGFETTPDYGLKILKSMEHLQKMPVGIKLDGVSRSRGGGYGGRRRMKAVSTASRGRSAWYQQPRGRPRDIALVPTLQVAALHQGERRGGGYPRLVIKPQDVRVRVREYRPPFSIVFLVDMSLSMISSMTNLVQAIYSLHENVYRRRDRVGLIVFKGAKAFTIQHPTTNLELVVKKLKEVGASDFTPMAAGLFEAWKVMKREKMRNRDAITNLIVFTDGIVNVPLEKPVSPLTRRKYSSEAQADSIDVARLIAKEKFKVHIINTNHSKEEAEARLTREEGWKIAYTPTQFLMELAHISKGSYHGLSLGG